jgi:predicted DNA-binding transcriptional regulator YafY
MVLSRFKGSPEFTWVQELIPKLEQTFNLKGDTKAIISFDDNRYLEGIEHLGKLFHAIMHKQPLEIAYKSFKSEKPNVSFIHPYYLKQYNNRWYLLGQTERFDSLSVRALDRIVDFKEVDIPFIENTQYDFEEYFEDVIGINKGKNRSPELIRLWFSTSKAPYILTKAIHGSQKVKQNDDNGLVITIEVIPNYELKSLLLSFGNEVKVLSPDWLHQELLNMAYKG